jgi:hypothetical protein
MLHVFIVRLHVFGCDRLLLSWIVQGYDNILCTCMYLAVIGVAVMDCARL